MERQNGGKAEKSGKAEKRKNANGKTENIRTAPRIE
jgi:hypothetical protein